MKAIDKENYQLRQAGMGSLSISRASEFGSGTGLNVMEKAKYEERIKELESNLLKARGSQLDNTDQLLSMTQANNKLT